MTEENLFYILDGKNAVPATLMEWLQWINQEGAATHLVKQTFVDGAKVSTIFLGHNHNWKRGYPLLFETMVFGGVMDEYKERYSVWEEAEQGHERICEMVKVREKERKN